MTLTTEEFVASFHSLHGTTIGERRKSLFHLLNKTQPAESSDLDLSSLHPNTPLEEKFKVEALIYFRRIPDLLEVLKSENPILINRILKAGSWFLEQAFQDITGEQLVTLVFPYLSFNVKVKILNKLSVHLRDSQKADQFFEAVNDKYGSYLASKLLPSCSADVIMSCVKTKKIVPTPRQLLLIVKKHPQLTEPILELLARNKVIEREYKNILVHLVQNDASLFLKLFEKHSLSLRLGWRATNAFILANKQTVIKNSARYHELLHKKQIVKSLKQDFDDFFFNLFPTSLAKLTTRYDQIFSLIEQSPVDKPNLELLFTTFKKVYGTELWDHPKYVSPKLLEMLLPSERESKLRIEYKPSEYTEDEWNCYWRTEKSIPYLKNRISLSSDSKTRATLVGCLVETCRINKDKVALANICKYMTTQHRNDHIAVRAAFLTALYREFELKNLEEEHWTHVHELIEIFALNKETFYDSDEFLEAYIHFRLRNDLPVKEELIKWLDSHSMRLRILDDSPQYQKECLIQFGEIIPELFKEDRLESYNLWFLSAVVHWNNRHPNPKDKISPFTYVSAIDTLKQLLIKQNYVYSADNILVHCLQTKTSLDEKSNLLNLYLKPTNKYADIDVMNWLIRYDLPTVIRNIDTIALLVSKVEADTKWFWKCCRNYSHLEIPQKIINILLALFREKENSCSNENELIKSNIITGLSYLMPSDEFEKFVAPYHPPDLRVDVRSADYQRMYGVQKSIGTSLKNVIPASHIFGTALAFCKGDYLKLVRVSLYSVANNTNEDKLVPFFNELAERAVSVRKHALHLTFRLLDKSQIFITLRKFMETEKNASIRKFIVKGVFNFFVKNPDDYSWSLVKSNVNAMDVNDKEALGILMMIEKIPRQYVVQYVVFTWDILSKLPDPDGEVTSKRVALLHSVTSDVSQLLPREFCQSVIQNLFNDKDGLTAFQSAIVSFTCKYIIYCNSLSEQEERLKSNFSTLKDYISNTWRNPATRTVGRSCATEFVKEFCADFLSNKCQNREILIKFADLWSGFLKPHESFDTYLDLQFTLIYTEKLCVPEIVQKLTKLCESLVDTYGSIVVYKLRDKLESFIDIFCDGAEKNNYDLIEGFVKPDSSVASLLLVTLLLDNIQLDGEETEGRYNRIIEILAKRSEPVIQLYLNSHF